MRWVPLPLNVLNLAACILTRSILTLLQYGVIGIEPRFDGETTLVKVMNPHGKGEWSGAWSDSDKATAELRKGLEGHKSADDGIFFMAMADFQVDTQPP